MYRNIIYECAHSVSACRPFGCDRCVCVLKYKTVVVILARSVMLFALLRACSFIDSTLYGNGANVRQIGYNSNNQNTIIAWVGACYSTYSTAECEGPHQRKNAILLALCPAISTAINPWYAPRTWTHSAFAMSLSAELIRLDPGHAGESRVGASLRFEYEWSS